MYLKFKFITKYLLLALLILGMQNAYCQSTDVIGDHFKALTQHDVKAIGNGYADDAQAFSPNWEGAKTGPAGITEVYTRYFSSSPDLVYKVINTINAGASIVVEYTTSGTLSNPETGTPDYMKGKKYTLTYCAVFTVKNGKITKETDYFDQVTFLKQVGFFDQH